MANTVISPNMLLPVPVVSVDPGPDWANNVNASLGIIDSHNHSTGQGVPINPSGMNINADLTFNSNNAANLRSARFTPQASPISGASDIGCIYESGVDLYYNDGNGNQIRITESGSVTGSSGTISGLPSGTASAAFAAGTFTFNSATNTAAAIVGGSYTVTQEIANGKGVTIAASVSQASNYDLILPAALPASAAFITSDSSGNLNTVLYSSGTYSPTLAGLRSGISASIVNAFSYVQIGNNVTVAGLISVEYNSTTAGSNIFTISTPITASVSAVAGGGAVSVPNNIYTTTPYIENTGNGAVACTCVASGSNGVTQICGVNFTYSLV